MDTRGEATFEITSWDEKPYLELDGGRKFTRATVAQRAVGDIEGDVTSESLMYYRPDGTASYSGYLHVTGRLGGRAGSFVLQSTGEYDGQTARAALTVVPGSGTDELTGLAGTGESASTHADYPNMPVTLTYDIG